MKQSRISILKKTIVRKKMSQIFETKSKFLKFLENNKNLDIIMKTNPSCKRKTEK